MQPANPNSSVLVAVDENNSVLWRALITGPDDTPYAGGVFIFDVYFPPRYPAEPPNVLLKYVMHQPTSSVALAPAR